MINNKLKLDKFLWRINWTIQSSFENTSIKWYRIHTNSKLKIIQNKFPLINWWFWWI